MEKDIAKDFGGKMPKKLESEDINVESKEVQEQAKKQLTLNDFKSKLQKYYKTQIGNKEIEFREWTAREEKAYLELIENSNQVDVTEKMLYEILIEPTIKEKDLVLSPAEQKKLLIDIRSKSISEYLEDEITCSKCNKTSNIKVKLSDIVKYKPSNYHEVEVEDIKVGFGPIKSKKDKDNISLTQGLIKYLYDTFMLQIEYIEVQSERIENFSKIELDSFIKSLPVSIFDKLFEEYQNMVDETIVEYDFECPECGHKEKIEYDNIPNFLWV